MWKLVAESVEGTSHQLTSKPCQDCNRVEKIKLAAESVVVLVCADGAGSADLSQIGARVACDRFFDLAYELLKETGTASSIDRETTLRWYCDVRAKIVEKADELQTTSRNLACTLLTAVVSDSRAVFAQVGDGTIVRRIGDTYQSVFWPQNGDYANVTNFVTQDNIETVFEFATDEATLDEVALLTDGLQRLVLNFAKREVHQAFFAPFFDTLRKTEDENELIVPLRTFLNSPSVNERTDDDKTLVLASRVNGQPTIR